MRTRRVWGVCEEKKTVNFGAVCEVYVIEGACGYYTYEEKA